MIFAKLNNLSQKVLWIYGLVLSLGLVVSGLLMLKDGRDLLILSLFIPLFLYFTRLFKNKKYIDNILLIYALIFSTVLLLIGLVSVKKIRDFFLTMMLLPMVFYLGLIFWNKLLMLRLKKPKQQKNLIKEEGDGKIVDYSKRKFLKLLAGTSLTTLLMFLLSKKDASAAFFGSRSGPNTLSVTDSRGQKIDPATNSPLDGYVIANIEENVATSYFGFTNKNGEWYIMRVDNVNNSFSYYKGESNYSTGWNNRIIDGNFKSFAETF